MITSQTSKVLDDTDLAEVPSQNFLQTEDGFFFMLEDGSGFLLLE